MRILEFEGLFLFPEVIVASPLMIAFIATLGLFVGSFLNVVIFRLPHGRSVVSPRSHCGHCGHVLSWYENIPVLSFLVLKGRCRKCKTKLSWRYPLVEVLTSVLVVASALKYGVSPLWVMRDFFFIAAMIAVVFIDIDHRIIPDEISLGGLVLGLFLSFFQWDELGLLFVWTQAFDRFLGAAIGFLIFWGIAAYYEKRTKREGLGGGDIKLLAMQGSFFGIQAVLDTILVSSVIGSIFGLTAALIQRKRSASELGQFSLPFGPFMVLGIFYHYFLANLVAIGFGSAFSQF